MIKLKNLIPEAKKLDMSKKEDAAEYLIRQVWEHITDIEEKFTARQVLLWIDNNYDLSNLADKFGETFYPDDEDGRFTFEKDIENKLEELELNRLERRKRATIVSDDPLYLLKKSMIGKSWNQAKNVINSQFPISFGNKRELSDEIAEEYFNRIYKNAMGETIFDLENIEQVGFGRLNTLRIGPDKDNIRQYKINQFLIKYGGVDRVIDGRVKVWRGTNNPHAGIRPGDFVTFNRGFAQIYMSGKRKSIVTAVLDAKDLLTYILDLNQTELVYWPEGHKIKKYTGHIPTLKDFWQQYR